ncbi:sensor histidine kinase [Rubritalea marina]|uniref:sensor histidine kinase n=1 Tax=Rubritalea marina TaxID=361055 RepID=UPI001969D779|nr:ATP-binding protein [Rubritalea marina]
MPLTHSDDHSESHPFGFPQRFKIECVDSSGEAHIVADFSKEDYPIHGIEPQIFECSRPLFSTRVRITIYKFPKNPIWWETPYFTGLSELYVFSGPQNIALNAPVKTYEGNLVRFGYTYQPHCLVDGFSFFSPLDWDISSSYDGFLTGAKETTLLYDLGSEKTVDEFRIWPVAIGLQENFPLANGTSFPRRIIIERLEHPGSIEGSLIYDSQSKLPRPGNTPLMKALPTSTGRFYRLTVSDPLQDFRISNMQRQRTAIAEFQLLGMGQVHQPEALPRILSSTGEPHGSGTYELTEKLSDGRVPEGRILPLKQWLKDFATRAALERKTLQLQDKLSLSIARERAQLQFFGVTCLGAVALLVLLLWIVRLSAQQREFTMREQISADLHDEVGANLTSIAHTTQLLGETLTEPSKIQSDLLSRADNVARSTAKETRNFIQFLQTNKEGSTLEETIPVMAANILGHIHFDYKQSDLRRLDRAVPNQKWHLFLFIKEALHNAYKHAHAQRVSLSVSRVSHGQLLMNIQDDGIGFSASQTQPRTLSHRAKRLGGTFNVQSNPQQGTTVSLSIHSTPRDHHER